MPRPRKSFPISFSLSLRERGYSYDMVAWKLRQLGYDVSKWTVMRRLSSIERSACGHKEDLVCDDIVDTTDLTSRSEIPCGHSDQETVDTSGLGQSEGWDFAPSTKDVQREKPGFNAEKFEEVSMDLLAGEVESFDELMDRVEGCE